MAWVTGDMRPFDRELRFAAIRAPVEMVLEATATAFGVEWDMEVVTAAPDTPLPPPCLEWEDVAGRPRRLRPSLRPTPLLVSTPEDAPNLALVEGPADLAAVSAALAEAPVVGFRSSMETERRQVHGIEVFRAGRIVRRIELRREIASSGWRFESAGAPAPWEDLAPYRASAPWRRLDRSVLFAQASRLGFDAEAAILDRKLTGCRLIDTPQATGRALPDARRLDRDADFRILFVLQSAIARIAPGHPRLRAVRGQIAAAQAAARTERDETKQEERG